MRYYTETPSPDVERAFAMNAMDQIVSKGAEWAKVQKPSKSVRSGK